MKASASDGEFKRRIPTACGRPLRKAMAGELGRIEPAGCNRPVKLCEAKCSGAG
jgi:hypothetical protein